MFAHEINYEDCTHCGSAWCWGQCAHGVPPTALGVVVDVQVLPTMQATQAPDGVRDRPSEEGQEAQPLSIMPERVSSFKKARAVYYSPGCNQFSRQGFSGWGELGDF